MADTKWTRRKDERPAEIIAAALTVFAEKGFAAARTEELAKRAGISKGALYLYFATKEDLFRAVVREAVVPDIDALQARIAGMEQSFGTLLRSLLPQFAEIAVRSQFGAVVKMVVGESGNFPELARIWHENVISRAIGWLTELIRHAQDRGECRAGDPRAHAFSIMGPMLMGVLWHETFTPIGGDPVDISGLARQHVDTVLEGLLTGEKPQ